MFCMLPLFSPVSAVTNMSRLALSEENYRGSNLELVVQMVERALANIAGEDCRHNASQLFLNEIKLEFQVLR